MEIHQRASRLKKVATTAGMACAALGLAACGDEGDTSGSEQKVSIKELQQTPKEYVGQTVMVSADVNDDISPQAFSIAGTDESSVVPLLVLHLEEEDDPEEEGETSFDAQDGLPVEVTGTVKGSFDVVALEEKTGKDLNETALENWSGQPYIMATEVDVIGDN